MSSSFPCSTILTSRKSSSNASELKAAAAHVREIETATLLSKVVVERCFLNGDA